MNFEPDAGKTELGLDMLRLRKKLKHSWRPLTQAQFAERFGLSVGTVKDYEQGRGKPSWVMMLLMAAIELDSSLIDRAVVLASERRRVREERGIARRCGARADAAVLTGRTSRNNATIPRTRAREGQKSGSFSPMPRITDRDVYVRRSRTRFRHRPRARYFK